jgi:hypothetical protein
MASRMHSWGIAAVAALSLALTAPGMARDGTNDVDLELVLAVDISYSMDRFEQQLQREGYVEALTSPEFLNALKSNAFGKIAVTYLQWASSTDQDVLLNWAIIDGPESAKSVADRLAKAPYRRAQRTSISGAIDASAKLFENNGLRSTRQVIDVSGDGPNNNGRIVTQARDDALEKGITINGLPLVGIREWFSPADIKELDIYYEDCVIGGPEAFSITVRNTKSFIEATRSKLVREVAALPAPSIGASVQHASGKVPRGQLIQAKEPRISCTIGESLWRGRWGN